MRDKKEKKPISYSNRKKLMSATAMLLVSALMLITTTVAWFTMNKDVEVTGMQMKAHAEEGLLINEVKAADSKTWDELATANTSPQEFQLRPASTSDLSAWWHANSKKSSDEAGIDALNDTVDVDVDGHKYTDITTTNTNVKDNTVIGAEDAASGEKATGNTKAETHVFWSDAHFGSNTGAYDNGEGFYVNYKYYLKSSSSDDISIPEGKLGVTVTATKKAGNDAATDLDKALRVGVKIGDNYRIFAPVSGADASYTVTNDVDGKKNTSVTPATAKTAINPEDKGAVTIPKVTSPGKLVDVYVWFEGEDTNCKSDNLTATLNSYEINIKFTDDALQ